MLKRLVLACVMTCASLSAVPVRAANDVPFKGTWTGLTLSADPTNFPVVSIVSGGGGQLTRLGRFEMVSPHTSDVFTGETIGDQIFTAANGDTLTAFCEGGATFGAPQDPVIGLLDCTFTSGTGRFADVTGSYQFSFVATPRTDGGPGYATVAEITGTMSSIGSSKR